MSSDASDKWCLQSGYVTSDCTVKLHKAYKDTNYSILVGSHKGNNGVPRTNNKTTTTFQYGSANVAGCPAFWQTQGYIN